MSPDLRLYLVGDDEVLDEVAELSRHLDYFQVARLEALPDEPLGARDHLLVAHRDAAMSARVVAHALTVGAPGYVTAVPELPGASVGARAIVAAAALVHALQST